VRKGEIMKIWEVKIPVAGYVSVEVEADSYNEAVKNGLKQCKRYSNDGELLENITELDYYEKLVEGNFIIFDHCKATAECIDDCEG
jgi:hypothetical protein